MYIQKRNIHCWLAGWLLLCWSFVGQRTKLVVAVFGNMCTKVSQPFYAVRVCYFGKKQRESTLYWTHKRRWHTDGPLKRAARTPSDIMVDFSFQLFLTFDIDAPTCDLEIYFHSLSDSMVDTSFFILFSVVSCANNFIFNFG